MTRRRTSLIARVMLATIVLGVTLGIAEFVVRRLPPPPPPLGQLSYQDRDGQPVTLADAVARGQIVPVPPRKTPRARFTWGPNADFYLCYSDAEALRRDWFDDQGRVFVDINEHGLRDRTGLPVQKPAGQQRILCVGDSFTFAWGIPIELGWVRLLEERLRADDRDLVTINCGAVGALCVDEYQWAVEHRFGKFEPDVVILTICLNDLIPSSGLFVQGPAPDTGSRLLDLVLGAAGHSPLALDPDRDWVGELLALPRAAGEAGGLYGRDKPFDAMWSQGAPQAALAALKTWCEAHNCRLLVTLWPFLQGLGPGRHYAFEPLHELVAAECQRLGIPFHDVLPALRDTPAEDLWVTPADMHANPTAQRLATPGIEAFVREHSGLF